MCLCVRACVYVSVFVFVSMPVYLTVCVYMCVCMCLFVCVCLCAFLYVCVNVTACQRASVAGVVSSSSAESQDYISHLPIRASPVDCFHPSFLRSILSSLYPSFLPSFLQSAMSGLFRFSLYRSLWTSYQCALDLRWRPVGCRLRVRDPNNYEV